MPNNFADVTRVFSNFASELKEIAPAEFEDNSIPEFTLVDALAMATELKRQEIQKRENIFVGYQTNKEVVSKISAKETVHTERSDDRLIQEVRLMGFLELSSNNVSIIKTDLTLANIKRCLADGIFYNKGIF
jgi:hypothetical protein